MALVDCTSAAHVIENYKAVRARMNALKPWTPPVVVEITPAPEPLIPWPIKLDPPRPALPRQIKLPRYANKLDPNDCPVFPRIRTIQQAVVEFYGVSICDLIGARREARIVRPRMIAVYLCKTLTPHSYPEIGRRFGGRDHSTAINSFQKISRVMKTDADLAHEIALLEEVLTT